MVQGVGYPNPDRSHFESMDRWQAGQAGAKGRDRLAGPFGARPTAKGPMAAFRSCISALKNCRWLVGARPRASSRINQSQPFELKLGMPGTVQEKAQETVRRTGAGLQGRRPELGFEFRAEAAFADVLVIGDTEGCAQG